MDKKLHFDDLTKICVSFGMLDDDTKRRLEASGPWDVYDVKGWVNSVNPDFFEEFAYRKKPEPGQDTLIKRPADDQETP